MNPVVRILRIVPVAVWVTELTAGVAAGGFIETLDPLVVFGDRSVQVQEIPVGKELGRLNASHLGEALEGRPGLSFVKRGHDIVDPQIRGLGFDRVVTLVNGLPVPHSSPTRTAAPINALGPGSISGVSVATGLASVSLGTAATGGYIEANTLGASTPEGNPGREGEWVLNIRPDRDGRQAFVQGLHRGESLELRGSAYGQDLDNYRSGDGREVAARFQSVGMTAGAQWRVGSHHLQLVGIYQNILEQENLALPLDTKDAETLSLSMRHKIRFGDRGLRSLSWALGYTRADPFLTIADRPLAPMPIRAESRARTVQFRMDSDWEPAERHRLRLGFLLLQSERNTIRYRGPFTDFIWPDTHTETAGAYAEWHFRPKRSYHVRLGARIDRVTSEARAADKPAFGLPIIDLYERYNGPRARRDATAHTVGAANLLVRRFLSDTQMLYGGMGYSVHAPAVTESFRAYLQALGLGFEIGNPSLDPEAKWEGVLGWEIGSEGVEFRAEGFVYSIRDYIQRRQIGLTTTAPANEPMFGYRNIDATFWGLECSGALASGSGLRFPFSLALLDAENRETGKGLPEIPPWEARVGFEHEVFEGTASMTWGIEVRHVGSRKNPAPETNVLYADTDAFTLIDLKADWRPNASWAVSVRVENLFDALYFEYLTPPTAAIPPNSGDLQPGERVPGPGFSASLSLRYIF